MPRTISTTTIIAAVVLSASLSNAQMTVQSFGPATWNSDPAIIDAATGMSGASFESFEDFALDPNLSVRYNSGAPTTDVTYDNLSDPRWDGAVGFSLVLPGTPVTTCMADRLEIVLAQPASRIGFGISLMEIAPGGPSPNPRLIVNEQEIADLAALPNYANGELERNVYIVVTAASGATISSFGIANPGNCDRVMMDRIGWVNNCGTSSADCNQNGTGDTCDIAYAFSHDCNSNGIPDECELGDRDCNQNGAPDECDLIESWHPVSMTGPVARIHAAASYDEFRHETILFGGSIGDGPSLRFGDTWSWNGINWVLKSTTGPTPRWCNQGLAYDPLSRRTLLFGGYDGAPNGELWAWNGQVWSLLSSVGPAPRYNHAVSYDVDHHDLVVFGGNDGATLRGDTWTWNGASWTQHSVSGPSPRIGEAMAYDPVRLQVVMFGGEVANAPSSETWEWSGIAWTSRPSGPIPPRRNHAMCYDAQRQRVIVTGGYTTDGLALHDTWEWDGAAGTWVSVTLAGPPPRFNHALAFDAQRARLVEFGGANVGLLGDTLEFFVNSADCDGNSLPDECELSTTDCNENQIPDACDIASGTSTDCNSNGIPDSCDLATQDCNHNSIPDSCDIASGQSQDCNANGIPDSCELTTATDCNNNAILDTCESAPIALGQPANYPAGDNPASIIAADLDNDGALDLAAADYNANTIAILKSNPTGLFNPPTTQPTGHAPFGLAAADIDADSKIDLITANESAGTVSVLRNLGGGAFAPHADYATGPGCFSVAVGDLNGDTKPDIATANEASNSVSVLINAGGGGFGSASNIPVAASPQFIAIADLDNDGDRDLVVVNTGPDKISILKNTGLGLFAAPVLYNTGEDPTSVAIADLDGDGRPDLAITNLSGNSLSIFRNVGAGAFALAATMPAGGLAPVQVVAKDINGDTYPDLIVTNSSSNTLTIHLNTGIGTFRTPTTFNVGARPLGLVAAALHGGGILDIAVANASDDSVSILRNYTLAPPPADCNLDTTPDACQTPDFYLANNLCASFTIAQPALLGFTDDGPAANNACAANRNFRIFAGRADAGANKIWRIRKDCTQAAFGSVLASPSSVLIDTHGYYAGGCTSPNQILVGGRSGSDDIISVLSNTTGAVCEQLIDNTIHGIGQMALAPDGRLYIGSTEGDCLMLFSKGVIAPLFCYPGRALRAVAIAPNGNVYVAGATDGILRILSPDGLVLNPNFAGCLQNVTSLAFASPGVFHNNLYAACSAPANRVLEIDLATGQTRPFLSNIAVSGIAFDPEGFMHLSIPSENRVLKLGARHPGDMNGDSAVTTQDIPGFIAAALLLPNAPLPVATADMNNDGCVNGKDIQLLVAALSGP